MPSLMLRGLPLDLVARLRVYAREQGVRLPEAAARMLAAGLDGRDARKRGAAARWRDTTPEQRAAMTATARAAALAKHGEDA